MPQQTRSHLVTSLTEMSPRELLQHPTTFGTGRPAGLVVLEQPPLQCDASPCSSRHDSRALHNPWLPFTIIIVLSCEYPR